MGNSGKELNVSSQTLQQCKFIWIFCFRMIIVFLSFMMNSLVVIWFCRKLSGANLGGELGDGLQFLGSVIQM